MHRLRFFPRALINWLRGATLEQQMRDEFAFHLESRAADLVRQRLSPEAARRQARLEFGSVESYKELARQQRRPHLLEDLLRDVGYGWRGLRRSPALLLTCVLSLGIGIGVNATIFTAIRSILRHQPTVSDRAHLVGVEPGNSNQFSYLNLRDLHESGIFDDVVGYRIVRMNLRVDGTGQRVTGVAVTGGFFQVLGVTMQLGRAFTSDEGTPARRPRVAVLSHDFWRRQFGQDRGVVGRTMHVNGETVEIVGILPSGYTSVVPLAAPEIYVPISALFLPGLEQRTNANGLTAIARLRAGDSPPRAALAVTGLGRELERRYPTVNRGLSDQAAVFPLGELVLRGAPPEIVLLPVIVLVLFGLVLLIACGNVAGLLLARATSRRHEIAVRIALGARRVRLVQTLLAEALLLGALSAAGGVALTLAVIPLLNALTLTGQLPLRLTIAPDAWLIVYAVLLALVTTLTCGLVPALRGTRVSVSGELSDSAMTKVTDRLRLRRAFVIGQVALSALLLVLSALFLRTAARAATLDPGFDVGAGVVARVALDSGRSAESRLGLAEQLTERLQALPDVRAVSVANMVPLAGDVVQRGFDVRGSGPGARSPTLVNVVGPRYFEAMGIAWIRGREFRWSDRVGAPPVVIVNQAFARRHFADVDPLGQFIRTGDEPYAEVVGVAADTKFVTLAETPRPLVYYSYAQQPSDPIVHVRVAGSPEAGLRAIQAAAEAVDPTALVSVDTLRQTAGLEITVRRVAGLLLASLGGVGLLLALVGLYGVMAYTVAAQQAEIGLRMALGASHRAVLSLVVGRGVSMIAAGLTLGMVGSLLLTLPLRALLVGVSPTDPIALATTAVVLLASGACASYLPARRATRVDPIAALRQH